MNVIIEKMVIINKRAKFDYEIIEEYNFGIVLLSSEIKALREGKCSLQESHLNYRSPHFWIFNMYIGEYKNLKHETRRDRIILLKKKELNKIFTKIKKKGYTMIPLEIFFNKKGYAKIKCALAIGKKIYDKRRSIKEKEEKREIEKNLNKNNLFM